MDQRPACSWKAVQCRPTDLPVPNLLLTDNCRLLSVYVYTYIYTYIYVYIHIFMCIYMCIYIYIYMYEDM